MNQIPEDLQKVHQKYRELLEERGEQFAAGFLTYMVEVDYEKRPAEEVLFNYIWLRYASSFSHEVEAILNGEVENDIIKGFRYGEDFSREMKFTYAN